MRVYDVAGSFRQALLPGLTEAALRDLDDNAASSDWVGRCRLTLTNPR